MKNRIKAVFPNLIAGFCALVFLDSLRYKFTDAPETQVIFGKLDAWAASLGAAGLFAQTGLFSQYVIGSAELLASGLLIIGFIPRLRRLQSLGFAIALLVMSGAVSFHLFSPLGIDPNNDGGGLFLVALIIWATSLTMVFLRRNQLLEIGCGIFKSISGEKN